MESTSKYNWNPFRGPSHIPHYQLNSFSLSAQEGKHYLEDKLTEVSWRMEMIREVRRFVSIIPSWILTERNYTVRLLQNVSGIASEFEYLVECIGWISFTWMAFCLG